MSRHQYEVAIRRQQLKIVANRELSQQRIDGSNLDAFSSTGRLQGSRFNVIGKIRDD
jgi:hypothetical protein